MRRAALTAVVLALVAAPAEGRFHYTHRFVATGQLVDHWTVDDPEDCGPVGDGTVTVDFTSAKPVKARPEIDPTHGGESGTLGSWALLAPIDPFGHVGSAPPKPARGTVDLVDNTVPRPSYDGSDCGSGFEKSGCGTHPLKPDARVTVAGYDRRFIYVDLGASFDEFGRCHIGLVDGFSLPAWAAGGTRRGDLVIRMPSPSKLRTHKVVTVTGSSHKRTTYGNITSDVTRTATVTFTRLR